MTLEPHNSIVEGLVRTCGWMRGSYDGPYPEEATAYGALPGASVLDLHNLKSGVMVVDGLTVRLRSGLGERLLQGFREGPATDVDDVGLRASYGEAHARVFGGRCVIVEIPDARPGTPRRGGGGAGEHRVLILIDAVTGKVIGSYMDRAVATFRQPFGTVWK
jgi:hypothetical protein